jgi:hypothetical protein
MKLSFGRTLFAGLSLFSIGLQAQKGSADTTSGTKNLFIDIHRLEPGKLKYEAVAQAHAKNIAVQGKYGVNFIRYWVDEEKGLAYCLTSSADTASIRKAHAEAHGLLPDHICQVTNGMEAALQAEKYISQYLGAGKVSVKNVAGAHKKDLAIQQKYGVNFISYRLNEKEGLVLCLSQENDSSSVISIHKAVHGETPDYVLKAKQGH